LETYWRVREPDGIVLLTVVDLDVAADVSSGIPDRSADRVLRTRVGRYGGHDLFRQPAKVPTLAVVVALANLNARQAFELDMLPSQVPDPRVECGPVDGTRVQDRNFAPYDLVACVCILVSLFVRFDALTAGDRIRKRCD
jgi:hypothetical protein